jgi:putative addiction module component (TIGR02574 family)
MTREQLLAEAMALDPKEREALAEELWLSLDHTSRDEIDAAWMEEVQRRIAAYERGEVEAVPGEEVMRRLRERLQRHSG